MNFYYEITIAGSKDVIEFKPAGDNDTITGVDFMFNSDDNTRDRDKNGRVEFKVYGKFNDAKDTFKSIGALANWAKSKKDIYRTVTISIRTKEGELGDNFIRTFRFDKVFCIDYTEQFRDSELTFELFMAQAPTFSTDEAIANIDTRDPNQEES